MDGSNASSIKSYFSKSRTHIEIMSLSERIPSARNKMKRGMGARTFGIVTTIWRFVYFFVGAIIFTDMVRFGFATFSETDRISAEYK